MNYKQLSKIFDSLIKDDARSEQRLNDLLNGPHANDIRYYFNQLNKCSEDKKRERVQTWVEILKEKKPEFAQKIIENYSEYLSEEQSAAESSRKEEEERINKEKEQQEKREYEIKREHGKQLKDLFDFVCEFLRRNDRLVTVADRRSTWNSYGGRIGSYSHTWYKLDGKKISDIYNYLDRYPQDLLVKIHWDGGYDYDFGMEYKGGSAWKWLSDWSNKSGSYDSDEDATIYKVKRCPKSLIQTCVKEATEKFTALTAEEIQSTINKIIP